MKLVECFLGKDLSKQQDFNEAVSHIVTSLKQIVNEEPSNISAIEIKAFLGLQLEEYKQGRGVVFEGLKQFAEGKETTKKCMKKLIETFELKYQKAIDKKMADYLFAHFFAAQMEAGQENTAQIFELFKKISAPADIVPLLDPKFEKAVAVLHSSAATFVLSEDTYEQGINLFVALAKAANFPGQYIHQLDFWNDRNDSKKPHQPVAPRVLYERMIDPENEKPWDLLADVVHFDSAQAGARTLLLLVENDDWKDAAYTKFNQFVNSTVEVEREVAAHGLAFSEALFFTETLASFSVSNKAIIRQIAAKVFLILRRINPQDARLKTFLDSIGFDVRKTQEEFLFQLLKNSFGDEKKQDGRHDLAKAWLQEKPRAIVVFDVVERLLQEASSPLLPKKASKLFFTDLIKNNWISDGLISFAKDNDAKKQQLATAVLTQWLSDNSLQIVNLLSIFKRLAQRNENSRSVLQKVFTSVLGTEQSYRVLEMLVQLDQSLSKKQFKTVSTELLKNKRIPGALQQCVGDESRYRVAEDFFLLLWRDKETETLANGYFKPFVSGKKFAGPQEMAVRVLMKRIQERDDPSVLSGLNYANALFSRSIIEALIRSMEEDRVGNASYFLFNCSVSDNSNIRSIYVQTYYLGIKKSADWAKNQLNFLSVQKGDFLELAKSIWNLIINDEDTQQYAVDKAFEALQNENSDCFDTMSQLMAENKTLQRELFKKIGSSFALTEESAQYARDANTFGEEQLEREGPSEKENAKSVLLQMIRNTEAREFAFPWINSILLTTNDAQQPVIDCLFHIFNAREAEISDRALDALVDFCLQEGTIPDSFKAYGSVDWQEFLVRRIVRAPAEKRKELCLELLQNAELDGKTALEAVMQDKSISIEALKELIEHLAESDQKAKVLGCLMSSLFSENYRIVQALEGTNLRGCNIPDILASKIIYSSTPISILDVLNPLIQIKAAKVAAEMLVYLLKDDNKKTEVLQSLGGFVGSNDATKEEIAVHVFMNAEIKEVNELLGGYASSLQTLTQQFAATVFAKLRRENPKDERLKEFLEEATDPNVQNTQEKYLFQLLQADLSNGSDETPGFQQAQKWLKDKKKSSKKSSIVFAAIDRLIQSSDSDLQPVISLFSFEVIENDSISDSLAFLAKDKNKKKQDFASAVLEKWLSDDGIPTITLLSTFLNIGFSKGNKNSRNVLQQVIGTVLEAENNYRVIELVVFLKVQVPKNDFSKFLRVLMEKKGIYEQLPEKLKKCTSTSDQSNSSAKFLLLLLQEQKTKAFARAVFQDFVDSEKDDVRDIAKRALIQEMQQAGKASLFNECVCSSEEKMQLCAGDALLDLIEGGRNREIGKRHLDQAVITNGTTVSGRVLSVLMNDKSTRALAQQYMKEYAETEKTRNVVSNTLSLLLAEEKSLTVAFDALDTYAKDESINQRIVATKVMLQLIKNEKTRDVGMEHLKQYLEEEGADILVVKVLTALAKDEERKGLVEQFLQEADFNNKNVQQVVADVFHGLIFDPSSEREWLLDACIHSSAGRSFVGEQLKLYLYANKKQAVLAYMDACADADDSDSQDVVVKTLVSLQQSYANLADSCFKNYANSDSSSRRGVVAQAIYSGIKEDADWAKDWLRFSGEKEDWMFETAKQVWALKLEDKGGKDEVCRVFQDPSDPSFPILLSLVAEDVSTEKFQFYNLNPGFLFDPQECKKSFVALCNLVTDKRASEEIAYFSLTLLQVYGYRAFTASLEVPLVTNIVKLCRLKDVANWAKLGRETLAWIGPNKETDHLSKPISELMPAEDFPVFVTKLIAAMQEQDSAGSVFGKEGALFSAVKQSSHPKDVFITFVTEQLCKNEVFPPPKFYK